MENHCAGHHAGSCSFFCFRTAQILTCRDNEGVKRLVRQANIHDVSRACAKNREGNPLGSELLRRDSRKRIDGYPILEIWACQV